MAPLPDQPARHSRPTVERLAHPLLSFLVACVLSKKDGQTRAILSESVPVCVCTCVKPLQQLDITLTVAPCKDVCWHGSTLLYFTLPLYHCSTSLYFTLPLYHCSTSLYFTLPLYHCSTIALLRSTLALLSIGRKEGNKNMYQPISYHTSKSCDVNGEALQLCTVHKKSYYKSCENPYQVTSGGSERTICCRQHC